ncbi:MAG TPA: IS200/IS605 family transposase [Isosphaeraceae bacterium]|nr:IS200/IS605 family transposase [Isosphaeraceae bacterium]
MAQSLSSILIHLIFSTKNRHPWINEKVECDLHKYLTTVLHNQGSPALAINGTTDHIHILFALASTVRLRDVVEEIKKNPSKWIKTQGPEYQSFAWQAGYGAFSLGQSNINPARKYIAGQKEHHLNCTFQEEFRAFLVEYEITHDERYVWD